MLMVTSVSSILVYVIEALWRIELGAQICLKAKKAEVIP